MRLWIELLRTAYYKNATELETLPNIDINIKCGNSLVSRFAIDADLSQALKKSKWTIDIYRIAVDTYRNAECKEQKREMERLIAAIKLDFRSEIDNPFKKKIAAARGKIDNIATEINTQKNWGDKVNKQLFKDLEKATANFKKLETEKDDIETNKIFENAFEWRFEFPEILNDEGDFIGFDVVIGNPPYLVVKGGRYNNGDYPQEALKTGASPHTLRHTFATGRSAIPTLCSEQQLVDMTNIINRIDNYQFMKRYLLRTSRIY